MKCALAAVLVAFTCACIAQPMPETRRHMPTAYPEPEATAAWRSLASSYVRKALRDGTLDRDPALNARIDAVMAAVGAGVAAIDPRFATASWKAILITDFGHGAAAFPGETILVDASFVRRLALDDDELALVLSHEAAHVVARHASAKLAFMAEVLGKERLPDARAALLEFLAADAHVAAFQPLARRQEREADRIGARIFHASGFNAGRALALFDKLARFENRDEGRAADSHDGALVRKLAVARVLEELQRDSPPRR